MVQWGVSKQMKESCEGETKRCVSECMQSEMSDIRGLRVAGAERRKSVSSTIIGQCYIISVQDA